jgi:hypothetical protein
MQGRRFLQRCAHATFACMMLIAPGAAAKADDLPLMGGDARAAIIAESTKRGMKPFLPPPVPFGSKQWPTLITPGPGPASIADLKQ